MSSFSTKSRDRLTTCSWDLQTIFLEVIKHYDCTVIEGHRGEHRQNKKFEEKHTKIKWPDGKHNSYPSHAVDVAPWPIPENWKKDLFPFYELSGIVKFVAKQRGISIKWGGDGDYKNNTFDDLVHFELL